MGKNAAAGAVQRAVITPGDHKAATGQPGGDGFILRALGVGIDLEFAANRIASRVIALGESAPAITITRTATVDRGPGNNESAVSKRRRAWIKLVGAGLSVDLEFGTDGRAGGVVALSKHAVSTAIGVAAIPIGDEETTVIQGCNGRLIL